MKKLFWVKILLFFTFSVFAVSCSTMNTEVEKNEIIATSIKLAQVKADLGQFEESQKVYETAISEVVDYRLVYNWALSCAKLNDYYNAISLCKQGYTLYPDHLEFLDAILEYQSIIKDYSGLSETCKEYLKHNSSNEKVKEILIDSYFHNDEIGKAYIIALSFIYERNYNIKALEILNYVNPEEWGVIYKELYKDLQNEAL